MLKKFLALTNCNDEISFFFEFFLALPSSNVSHWPVYESVYISYYTFTNGNWPRNIYDPIKLAHFFLAPFEIHRWKYRVKHSKTKGKYANAEKKNNNQNNNGIHEVIIQFNWTNNNIIIPYSFHLYNFISVVLWCA